MKTNKETEAIILRLASKYLTGLGLSRSQVDYLQSVLSLAYRMGDRDGSIAAHENVKKMLKK